MPTLNWIGKEAVVKHHKEVPYRLLEPIAELSVGEPHSGNLIVQGDNLHALKALLPRYAGQVKCIYIDPPYNTGNEGWVYNDNVNSPEIKKWLGEVVGKEGETLDRHDRWLCMMYPRLQLLKKFLSEDGVILVSMDDNEAASLKLLMDEIFGGSNFISQIVWEKGRKNDAKFISNGHEYILVYAINKNRLIQLKTVWRERKPGADEIQSEYKKLKSIHGDDFKTIEVELSKFYKSLPKDHPSKKHSRYNKVDKLGIWRDDNMSWPGGGGPTYDVIHPITKQVCSIPPGGWRYSTIEKMQKMIDEGKVVFRDDHSEPPIRKTYLVSDDVSDEQDDDLAIQVAGSYFYRSSLQASNELSEMLGMKAFDYPKDSDVLARWIEYVTTKDSIILDSFAGSGTTAHAVLKINSKDNGNRKFILVEMDEEISESITAVRVKKAINGYTTKQAETVAGLGGSFQFCKLSHAPLFTSDGQIRPDVTFAQLAEFVWFMETGSGYSGSFGSSPLLGTFEGRAIYLLYNGILKDKSVGGGNVLTAAVLGVLPEHQGPKVIYAAANRLGSPRLTKEQIIFKQTPYALGESL